MVLQCVGFSPTRAKHVFQRNNKRQVIIQITSSKQEQRQVYRNGTS